MNRTPLTSIADLLFRAKTDEMYRLVTILGVKGYLYTEGRPVDTFEQAIKELDEYLEFRKNIDENCFWLVKNFNFCQKIIAEDEELRLKFEIVKSREGVPNFNGDVYLSNPSTTFRESPIEPLERHVSPRQDYETLYRYAINPITMERLTFTRVIPINLSVEDRRREELELIRLTEREIDRLRRNGNRDNWRSSHYENVYAAYGAYSSPSSIVCSEDNPCEVCRSL